ncbi:DUF4286 family protein [Noviherbaspirillum sedimenti]|uniref:DUF4286 family protein n=1 Tax=Noviherbaspirillum sedimenti TaxID=2320865 RepID=UPI0011C36B4F|nr:DUF4286 family protein [Noviherbaspirillum sedimenti]
MKKFNFVVWSNPQPGTEEEYNAWYTNQHLADVLKVPGFVAAQRFKLAQAESALPGRYLAIYEMETDDPEAALAELFRRSGTAEMPLNAALDMNTISTALFAAITDKVAGGATTDLVSTKTSR